MYVDYHTLKDAKTKDLIIYLLKAYNHKKYCHLDSTLLSKNEVLDIKQDVLQELINKKRY